MASIQVRKRRDGSPVYRVLFRHDGKQTTETFDSFTGADAFVTSIRVIGLEPALTRLAARRSGVSSTIPTLAEYARRHVEGLSGITEGTRRDYLTYIVRDFEPTTLGQTPIDAITRRDVAAWVTYLHRDRGLSGKSIRNRHALVSAAFTAATLDKIRPDNPCRGVRLPTSTRKAEMVFISGSEFAILLGHIPAHFQPFVTFLYANGLRWGEATALEIRDLDFGADTPTASVTGSWKHTAGTGEFRGPPKTKKGHRSIGLGPEVTALLRRITAGRKADDLVFVNRQGRRILHSAFYNIVWRKAVDAAEPQIKKRPRIHDLRHSAASNMIRAGLPANVIQAALGHESVQVTFDVYGHLAGDALASIAAASSLSLVEAYPELEA